jgi:PAS domain S-box-containing protein
MWQRTFDAVPDLIAIVDTNYRIVRVNEAMAERLGVSKEACVGQTCYTCVHGANGPPAFCPHTQLLQDGEAHTVEIHEERLAGDFLVSVSPLMDSAGRLMGSVHVARETSERKSYEREIERVNRLDSALSELNKAIVHMESREELFQDVCRIATQNAGFRLAWIGWVEEETHRVIPVARAGQEQDYLDGISVYADDRPEGRGPTGTCIRENRVYVVHDFLSNLRTAPWHEAASKRGFQTAAALPICFQGATVGALTIYDIEPNVMQDNEVALLEEAAAIISFALERLDQQSQRKQAEEALERSEASLAEANQIMAGVLEHTHMMAVLLDRSFNFVWVNRAYAATCRQDPSFFPGKNHFDLYPHEENRAIFQRVVDTGEPFFVSAKPFVFPDQPERGVTYWDWSLIPVKDDSGKVINLVFTLIEVTERVIGEKALLAERDQLLSVALIG